MRQPTAKSCYYNQRKPTIAGKKKTLKNPIKIAKTAVPATWVVIAGPAVSYFPLGSIAPIFGILATSFASTYLDRKAIGMAVVLIQGCGLRGFEGRMLALLSFLSFSSTFEKLGESLEVSPEGLLTTIGIIQSGFVGALLSTCAALHRSLQAMAFAVHGLRMSTLILASQLFSTSCHNMSSPAMLISPLEVLVQVLHDSHNIEGYAEEDGDSSDLRQNIPSDMPQEADSKYPPNNDAPEASLEDLLANCETVEEYEAQKVIRLIDKCDGTLSPEEWDEIIAALD